jgi:hypothetical protein
LAPERSSLLPRIFAPVASRFSPAAVMFALASVLSAGPAHALRIVDYNLLNYPGSTGPARDPYYRTVLQPLGADIVVAEEVTSQAAVNEFLSSVLNTLEPGQWAAAPFIDGNDTDCGLFYKPAKVQFLAQSSFYCDTPILRLIHVYRVRPVGYDTTAANLNLYAMHLKASQGFESQRAAEATVVRDSMNLLPAGSHGLALGDFNLYTGTEPALTKFLENEANNIGRLYDPLGLQGVPWQDNASIAIRHTQCPSTTAYRPNGGFSGGGLDDRFDLILPTLNFNDGQGYELVANSYVAVGNDGLHLNKSVTDPPLAPADSAYARALWFTSDHLPVRVDLQVPSRIQFVPSAIAFGSVIVGGPASELIFVANSAQPPADNLDYSFSATAGFTAPAGNFSLPPLAPPGGQPIDMSTATAGVKSGTLTITSDAPDDPTIGIPLSGTVLDHANASLDSTSTVLAELLDFGGHTSGDFATELARVHNLGYDALHARLSVSAGAITGGAGRFSIVGGFAPALVAGTAASYTLAFDDLGATQDSTYEATLTFTDADEPLPGALAQPSLVVTLRAQPLSGTTGIAGGALPRSTKLYAPVPNPVFATTSVRFDLASRGTARIEVFDLAGRRVALLADRAFEPGTYSLRWDARSEAGGTLGSGLYFLRLSGPGLPAQTARLAVAR